MGVPATVTFLKNKGSLLASFERLKDCRLIIDTTDSMYWFVKKNKLNTRHDKMDVFGTSMQELGNFFRKFFADLRAANISPVVVFEGARLSALKHGDLVSKERFLERSARIRMMLMNRSIGRPIGHDILPTLTANVIKEVIEESRRDGMNIETYQAPYETYPVLEMLADRYACCAFTSHSDFILSPCSKGFLWAEQYYVREGPTGGTNSQPGYLAIDSIYQHRRLLQLFRLQEHGKSLKCLYALMRPDFAGAYYDVLNRLFSLPAHLAFREDNTRFQQGRGRRQYEPCMKRLEHILGMWNTLNLKTPAEVRARLAMVAGSSPRCLTDYDALMVSFTFTGALNEPGVHNPFRDTQLSAETIAEVHSAVKDRQSTFSFMSDVLLKQKNFNRLTVEDLKERKSSWSLGDKVRQVIMELGNVDHLKLMDRVGFSYEERSLARGAFGAPEVDQDKLIYKLFNFPEPLNSNQSIDSFQSILSAALRDNYARHLIVLLALAKFVYHEAELKNQPKYAQVQEKFYDAIFNSFMFHATSDLNEAKMLTFKLNNRVYLPEGLRDKSFVPTLSTTKMEIMSGILDPLSSSDPDYIVAKHLIECLNSAIHYYVELNALKNYPAAKLENSRYYDGVLIYKLFKRLTRQKPGNSNLLSLRNEARPLLDLLM